jgi:fermentation-respiration switch protein FrsA (DUF1100 family)
MLVTLLIAFAVVYVGLAALLCGCQRSFMYFPDQVLTTPAGAGLPDAETVRLRTEDGLDLTAWLIRAESRPFMAVVFHGNAGNISNRTYLADVLWAAGCSVMLVEYRGYGGNPGSPTEEGLYRDARAALAYLESRPDVDKTRLLYFGESIGSGPATQLAVERAPAGLILDCPFTSMPDVAADHYWYLPTRWLVWDKYDNLAKIGRVNCPVLVIHAGEDRIVPTRHGRRLFEAAREPKQLVVVLGADHNDHLDLGRPQVIGALKRFLAQVEAARLRPAP